MGIRSNVNNNIYFLKIYRT